MNTFKKITLSIKKIILSILLFCFAALAMPAFAESFNLVDGDTLTIDLSKDQRSGDVYFVTWYQNQTISWRGDWFQFDLAPADSGVINIDITREMPEAFWTFVQFTVPRFSDPNDLNNWRNVKTYEVNIQHCSGFSPPIPGCELRAPWWTH